MNQTPIHLICSRIKRLSLQQQIHHLRALVKQEKLHSVRRNELQSLLEGKMLKQIKIENRSSHRVPETSSGRDHERTQRPA